MKRVRVRTLRIVVAAVGLAGALPSVIGRPPSSVTSAADLQADAAASAILRRAQEFAGGAGLRSARSVCVDYVAPGGPHQMRLVLPGRYRLSSSYSVRAIDNGAYSSASPVPPRFALPSVEILRRRLEGQFIVHSMLFLLRVPPGLGVRLEAAGRSEEPSLDGEAIRELRGSDAPALLVFSRDDGRLLGRIGRVRIVRFGQDGAEGSGVAARQVIRITAYQEVGGLKFPSRWETVTYLQEAAPSRSETIVQRVILDASTPSDFAIGSPESDSPVLPATTQFAPPTPCRH